MDATLTQVSAVQRRRVGACVVTALNDGFIELPAQAFMGVAPPDVDLLYRRAGRRPPYRTAINCYVVQGADGVLLIDTGAGRFMGEHLGRALRNLSEAGLSTEEVDTVFLTHFHTDHIGGTLTKDDVAAFPSATIVVAREELSYWADRGNVDTSPEATRDAFDVVERMLRAYRGRITTIEKPTELLPDVRTLPLFGHTPGHTGVEIGVDADLIMCGDIVHAAELQLARPNISMAFDVHASAAEATRRALLQRACEEDTLLAGTHIAFPGFMRVLRSGDGFSGAPETWQYDLMP